MSLWVISEKVRKLTAKYVKDNMPYGTTDVVITPSVESIGFNAFRGYANLTSVNISEGVVSISNWAFAGCISLTSVAIPKSVQSIGSCVFYGCTSLTFIDIPNGVKSIGYRALMDCTSLTSVIIPNSVEKIGDGAFMASGLNLIVLPDCQVVSQGLRIYLRKPWIRYGAFMEWKFLNSLDGRPYLDRTNLFLYQLKEIESFNPTWNEILHQCPEVGLEDLRIFSRAKALTIPLGDHLSILGQIGQFGRNILSHLTVIESYNLQSTAKTKILNSQSLFDKPCTKKTRLLSITR